MPDKIDLLFDDLQSRGYAKDKTRQQFRDYMLAPGKQGYENRKTFFEDFKSNGETDLGTYEDFKGLLGLHAVKKQSTKPANTGASASLQQRKETAKQALSGGTQRTSTPPSSQQQTPTPMQLPEGFGQLNTNLGETEEQRIAREASYGWTQDLGGQIKKSQDTTIHKALQGDREASKAVEKQTRKRLQQRLDEAEYEKETGKQLRNTGVNFSFEAPTIARDENGEMLRGENGEPLIGRTTDEAKAKTHQQVKKEQEEYKSIEDQLKEAYAERVELQRKMSDVAKRETANRKGPRFPLMTGGTAETYTMSEDSKNLSSAMRLLERRIDALEAKRDDAGFWRGTGDTLSDPSSYSFGLTDLADASVMSDLKSKLDKAKEEGTTPVLTDSEQALVRNYMKNEEADQLNAENWWYNAGQGFGETLSFMKDFAVTGGGFANIAKTGMRAGAKGGAKAASQLLGDYMTKNLGTKALGKTIEYSGKAAGLMVGAEAGGFLLNNTVQAASSAADILNRQTGNLTYDKDGNLTFKGGKSLGEAILTSQISRTGENGSELVGLAFDAMPGILGRVIQRTTAGKVLKRITDNKFWKKGEKGLDFLGVQSVWGEGMEEEYGMARTEILNTITNGNYDPNGSGLLDLDRQIDTWKTVGLTSMILRVPSMIVSGTQAANYYANRYNLNTSDNNMRETFDNTERYSNVKNMIDNADNKQIAGVLSNLMKNAQLSTEEKRAIMLYANDLVKMRGFNIGNVVAAANGYQAPPRVSNYNIRGLHVDAVDEKGNVLESYDYKSQDELKTGLYEMQQKRADEKLQSDIGIMKSRPDNQFFEFALQFIESNPDYAVYDKYDDFVAVLNKPSMERTEEEQQMVAAFADQLHNAVYDNTILHEEQSQQDGEELADSDSIDIEEDSEQGKPIVDGLSTATENRLQLFANNEELKTEVEEMEKKGLSHQEIISNLETFRPEEVQGMIDYYNAKAKYDGYMTRKAQRIDEEASQDRERRTFTGTINGNEDKENLVTITDGENTYTLVSGNITTDKDGRVTGTDSGLMIGLDKNGDFVNISDKANVSIVPSGMTLQEYEGRRREELQVALTQKIDSEQRLMPQEQSGDTTAPTEEPKPVQSHLQESDLELWPDVKAWLDEHPEATVGQMQREFKIGFNKATRMAKEYGLLKDEESPRIATNPAETNNIVTESETPQGTALDRIPKDEGGNPIYEQGAAEDTYDVFSEMAGSEEGASALAQSELNDANERLKKLQEEREKQLKGKFKGNTIQEKADEIKETKNAIEAEEGKIKYWNSVLAVPQNRKKNNPPAETPTTPTPPVDGVPEYRYDTPKAARERGFKKVEGHRVDRQEEKPMPKGMEVEVQYSTKDKVKGHLTVSELDDVQGSHLTNGQRNEKHFLPEAQPKAEFGTDRQAAAQTNASEANFRPELMITFNGTQSAYSGSASQTNRRGEVIQGNGRRNLAEYIYAPGNEAVAKKYKDFLKAHAAELGTTAEEIDKMEKPFAHIVLDVTDAEAIRLGQFTAQDLESGGKKVPEISNVTTKLGGRYSNLANIILNHEDPDASLSERIEANAETAVKWLNNAGVINNTEAKTLLEDKALARQFLKDVITDQLFKDAHPDLRTMFYELPKNIQSAIISVVGREVAIENGKSILKDIQDSIRAYHELIVSSPEFANAQGANFEKRYAAASAAVNDWLRQINMDGTVNSEKFSNFALELAKLYKSLKDQKTLAGKLREYYDIMGNVPREGGLFDTSATSGAMTREQALEQIFGIKNGTQRTMPVAGHNQEGETGGEGGTGNPQSGERDEGEGGPSDNRGGGTGNAEVKPLRKPKGTGAQSREDYLASHPLTEAQIMADTEATEDEKLNAIDFLKGEDDSAISRFYYDGIYERAQKAEAVPQPTEKKPTPDPMAAIEQAAQSFRKGQKTEENKPAEEKKEKRSEQKSKDQQDIDDALKEFNDFLDNAKGSNVLDKFMRKGLEGNDKAQANLLDAFTLTNEAQRMFLKDLLRLASKVGYAYIKSGVHDVQDWSRKMSGSIGKKLKEVLGWDDAIVGEFVDEVWNQKYTVDGQRMRLSEHAERLKNNKGEDTAVNVNKNENNEAENVVSSQQKAAKPQLEGDSVEFAERQKKIDTLREKVRAKLKSLVMWNDKAQPMSFYKKLAEEAGLSDLSSTDLQEIIEAEVVNYARELASKEGWTDKQKYDHIVRLYNAQPSLNARDNDRINLQQYSTPAPMAYLMGLFTSKEKKVESGLEPSAGNGMLTINLPKEKMQVNDIDEMRLSNLQKQGFGEVTSQDGTQSFGGKKYDVIVTNPPFGNVTPKVYDGLYEISGLEHQMAINALESMKDDGRAAIIIGGNTEYNQNGSIKGKDRVFLNYLYAHYNVVDVINMDGKTLYSRQGTGYPVRMILINGRKEFNAKDFAPVQSKARAERVNSYEELFKRVNDDILRDNNKSDGVHNTESGTSGRVDDNSNVGNTTQTGVRTVRTGGSQEQPAGSSAVRPSVQGGDSTTNRTDIGSQPTVGGRPSGVGGRTNTSQPSGTTATQTGGQRELSDGGNNSERPTATTDNSVGLGQRGTATSQQPEQPAVKRGLGTEKVPYRKQSGNPFTLQSLMPAEQADVVKGALEDLGDVDQFLVDELGYSSKEELHQALAAEQIDSVAMAIHQMNKGNAFIIGDQTGIGKGRQAAALIRYGVKKGGCPVFITVKKALFSDMYRDLCDIGSPGLRPFIWSADDTQHSGAVTDKDGKVIYEMPSKKEQERVVAYINKNGKLPPEYDYVLTTYDSFKSGTMDYENGQKTARRFPKGKSPSAIHINGQAKRDALETLAHESYVIMDESHNAGGEGSNVSKYLQYITTRTRGITFLSATFAKRPGNMPIYSLKTAIAKAGVAVDELIDAVKRGGATFQEIMSKALTEAGQMIRRERDMTGVTIDWKGIEDEDVIQKQREQYDEVIGLFNDIINFQRTYVDPIIDGLNDAAADVQGSVDHTPGTRDMGINNTPFASRTYNIVQQVLLSLKAEEAAKRAIEHLKAGRKPVITVANTNEGAADEVVAAGSDSMEMPDLSVNLKKGLRGTLRFTEKDAFGNTTNREIPFDRLSPEGQARYREIMDAIDSASTGLSLSPIDVIKNELKKAGYRIGELTGRQSEFVYNEDGTVKRVRRTNTDKKKIASDFNNGKLDALILNRSAGTGISLHASSKFNDQRQRVMIVAQAQGDVNDEVQIRGRIDRTGQVMRGMYEYIVSQIPSEQRLLMMLKAKLRSLDANTTSSQKSKFNEMQVQDIINKYGDDIVIQYLAEHPDLADKMCNPLKWKGDWQVMSSEQLVADTEKDGEAGKTASKVLGRMALLTVNEQEKMLTEIGDLYQAEIDRLNEMGENDLEITEMPLRAKTIRKDVWEQGVDPNGNNPFADNSYVEKVQMDVLKKPMKAEEVKRAQAHLLGGKTWDEYKKGVLERVDEWAENKKKETTDTITARAEKKAKAEQERYVKGAKKAQAKNGMTDEEIEKNGQFQYKTIYEQEMTKLDNALDAINKQKQVFVDVLELFDTDRVFALPSNIYDLSSMTFEPGMGKLIDVKISDNFSTTASTISFATLDGRRKITIPVSGMVKQQNNEKRSVFPVIVSLTAQTKNGMFGSNVANTLKVLGQNIDNWDKLTSSAARKDGYIITGNLLKALVSTREQGVGGKLISYTTDTGEVRQGILMPENFDPKGLTSKTPISSRKEELKYSRDEVVSADGDVKVRVTNDWDWSSRGYNTLELIVPKSKKKGERYFNDEVLLGLMNGQFEGSGKMKAEFPRTNLDAVMKRLDELGVTVTEENNDNNSTVGTGRRYDEDIDEEVVTTSHQSEHKSRIAKHIDNLVKKLGTKTRTVVYHSFDELPEDMKEHVRKREKQGRKVRGWYENGRVYLYLPHIDSVYQAEKTIWHETVAHHGLRQLIGEENLNKLLKQLWLTHRDGEMGKWVTERMQRNGWALNEAIEEYLAREAEKNPFKEPGLWQRVKWMLADALHKIGFATDPTISDIQYLFWLSQNQLRNGDALSVAKKQAFLHRLEREAENTPYVNMNATRVEDIGRRFDESAPVFISNALEAVANIKQEKATPEQWLKMIEKNGGLKAGEDKWMGLSEWLKGSDKKSLTKQEVLDFIRENQIQIEEVNYSEKPSDNLNARIEEIQNEFNDVKKEIASQLDEFKGDEDASKQLQEYSDYLYDKYGAAFSLKYTKEEGEKFSELVQKDVSYKKAVRENKDVARTAYRRLSQKYGEGFSEAFELRETYNNSFIVPVKGRAEKFLGENIINDTRSSYTTSGLKNKKEIALTVPTIESWNEDDNIHFGDAGNGRAVAWVRFGETEGVPNGVDADRYHDYSRKMKEAISRRNEMTEQLKRYKGGMLTETQKRLEEEEAYIQQLRERYKDVADVKPTRVLVIDEIQSKRHQEGREKGYKRKNPISKEEANRQFNEFYFNVKEKYGNKPFAEWSLEDRNEYQRLDRQRTGMMVLNSDALIPDAPFEKNWHELAMKRMLRYAAENGYDKVAWTKGEQQAERYDIGNTVKKIISYDYPSTADPDGRKSKKMEIRLTNGETMTMRVNEEGKVVEGSWDTTGKNLSDVVGKDLAVRIMGGEGKDGTIFDANKDLPAKVIEGEGLRIGGEGMKGFYDQMLPRFMDKYGKKWGVKTGEVELPNVEESGRKMWSVDVTPSMKSSVMEGQRMFDEDIEEPLERSAKQVYEDRLNRVETVFSEAYQDAMVSLKTAQNAIAKDKEIPDSQNAYMAENLMHGKNKNEQDLFNRMFRDPLIRTINKIMNLTGMNWGDVDRYVYTKSGLERNREFFVRDWLEAERSRTIRKYDDLNEEEQEIYDRMANRIETDFEDGLIANEEEKNKKLTESLQKAHEAFLDKVESDWQHMKEARYHDLENGYSIELTVDNFTYADYLNALSDFIRNNVDNSYNPSEHDYSGFRAMFGDAEGKYDEKDIIDELMNTEDAINTDPDGNTTGTVDELWEQIRNATRYGLERYREAGMRSDEQIDQVEQMFHWYVPMRGFKEDRGEDMYQYFTGKGRTKNYVGGLLKHAKGRGSEANYPISTIFAMTYKAISDCNQNLVNQKLYRLCQSNPNDLIVLSDSWAVLNEQTGLWEESSPEIPADASEEDVREATLAWEEQMKELANEGKAMKITGKPRFDYVPMDKQKKSEHEIDVRINGKPRKMIVTGNPRMAQALNGQLRFERGHNIFSKWNADIKNFMASLFTSYSPTFALRNLFRDWTHFRMMLGVREGEGYAKQANKYYRQTLFKMVGLFKKYREGTLDMNNEVERDFKDFMDNGGITGFVFMQKIDDIQKEMKKLYEQQKEGKAIKLNNKLWDYTLGAIEAVNEGIENNARFATYRASRHYAQRTKARSAYDAKEITVNFNRKGAGSKTAGFKSQSKAVEDAAKAFGVTSQILGEGRIFFNATVQAIATTFKNFQNSDGSLNKPYIAKWAGRYAIPPFMFGLALPLINKALAAAFDGDDDDDAPYANLAEWTRRKNICIYIGNNNFITIPIGQELAAFLTLGDIFAGNTYAQELKPVDKGITDELLGAMNTFSPVDIDTKITKGGLTKKPLDEVIGRTFSVLAPLVAVQQNIGWTGRPIYREDLYKDDKYTPEYQMVYNSTNPVLVSASKYLHELGGGDDVKRGKEWSEVNPGIVQYLWEQYTGGPGKVFANTISIGKDLKDLFNGETPDFNMRKVEGLKAFVQQGDDRTSYYRVNAKWRKYKEDAEALENKIKGYKGLSEVDPTARSKYEKLSKSKEFVRMDIALSASKYLNKMNKYINKAEGSERNALKEQYNKRVKEVVDMLDSVK